MAAHAVEGDSNEIGFNGALRADIGPSLRGDGIEVLITDQTYKELDACPKGFFVPTKGGPWTCLEITVTATNNVSRSCVAWTRALVARAPQSACLSASIFF